MAFRSPKVVFLAVISLGVLIVATVVSGFNMEELQAQLADKFKAQIAAKAAEAAAQNVIFNQGDVNLDNKADFVEVPLARVHMGTVDGKPIPFPIPWFGTKNSNATTYMRPNDKVYKNVLYLTPPHLSVLNRINKPTLLLVYNDWDSNVDRYFSVLNETADLPSSGFSPNCKTDSARWAFEEHHYQELSHTDKFGWQLAKDGKSVRIPTKQPKKAESDQQPHASGEESFLKVAVNLARYPGMVPFARHAATPAFFFVQDERTSHPYNGLIAPKQLAQWAYLQQDRSLHLHSYHALHTILNKYEEVGLVVLHGNSVKAARSDVDDDESKVRAVERLELEEDHQASIEALLLNQSIKTNGLYQFPVFYISQDAIARKVAAAADQQEQAGFPSSWNIKKPGECAYPIQRHHHRATGLISCEEVSQSWLYGDNNNPDMMDLHELGDASFIVFRKQFQGNADIMGLHHIKQLMFKVPRNRGGLYKERPRFGAASAPLERWVVELSDEIVNFAKTVSRPLLPTLHSQTFEWNFKRGVLNHRSEVDDRSRYHRTIYMQDRVKQLAVGDGVEGGNNENGFVKEYLRATKLSGAAKREMSTLQDQPSADAFKKLSEGVFSGTMVLALQSSKITQRFTAAQNWEKKLLDGATVTEGKDGAESTFHFAKWQRLESPCMLAARHAAEQASRLSHHRHGIDRHDDAADHHHFIGESSTDITYAKLDIDDNYVLVEQLLEGGNILRTKHKKQGVGAASPPPPPHSNLDGKNVKRTLQAIFEANEEKEDSSTGTISDFTFECPFIVVAPKPGQSTLVVAHIDEDLASSASTLQDEGGFSSLHQDEEQGVHLFAVKTNTFPKSFGDMSHLFSEYEKARETILSQHIVNKNGDYNGVVFDLFAKQECSLKAEPLMLPAEEKLEEALKEARELLSVKKETESSPSLMGRIQQLKAQLSARNGDDAKFTSSGSAEEKVITDLFKETRHRPSWRVDEQRFLANDVHQHGVSKLYDEHYGTRKHDDDTGNEASNAESSSDSSTGAHDGAVFNIVFEIPQPCQAPFASRASPDSEFLIAIHNSRTCSLGRTLEKDVIENLQRFISPDFHKLHFSACDLAPSDGRCVLPNFLEHLPTFGTPVVVFFNRTHLVVSRSMDVTYSGLVSFVASYTNLPRPSSYPFFQEVPNRSPIKLNEKVDMLREDTAAKLLLVEATRLLSYGQQITKSSSKKEQHKRRCRSGLDSLAMFKKRPLLQRRRG